MANVRNNRRFRDTERRIEEAALGLAEAGERLTVRAVCERAQVNRSTFYAHFQDVPDMMARLEERLDEELLGRYLAARDGGGTRQEPLTAASLVLFLEHIRAHRRFYRVALATRREFPLEQGRERMWAELVEPMCRRAGITDREHMMCLFVAFQAGFTMVLRRWVDADCQESIGRMADVIASCVPRAWADAAGATPA